MEFFFSLTSADCTLHRQVSDSPAVLNLREIAVTGVGALGS